MFQLKNELILIPWKPVNMGRQVGVWHRSPSYYMYEMAVFLYGCLSCSLYCRFYLASEFRRHNWQHYIMQTILASSNSKIFSGRYKRDLHVIRHIVARPIFWSRKGWWISWSVQKLILFDYNIIPKKQGKRKKKRRDISHMWF